MARRSLALTASCLTMLMSGGAMAQVACDSYKVKVGDNLRNIARVAYGDGDLYRVVYDANIAIIGPEADLIEIGAVLEIPCDLRKKPVVEAAAEPEVAAEPVETAAVVAPEPVAEPVAEPEVITPAAAAAPVAEPGQRTIGFVTGNGYAPFTDEMLPGGGMMTQVVEMAVFRADPSMPYTLTFINDWQAHLDALLPSGAYDLSFPWQRPNCEEPEALTAGDLGRCENFVFSDPMFEIVEGFFATTDSGLAKATRYDELFGKRICRPEGSTTGVLDKVGLTGGAVTMMRPVEVQDCFTALMAGKTDVVAVDADVAAMAISVMGLQAEVEQNPHLTTVQTLHIIAHKSNTTAVDTIGMINRGLGEMYTSGEWYDIVSTALSRSNLQQ